jgi:sirohydrochlorin ferrochelatase
MTPSRSDAALLIVGHGSTVNPDSSRPSLDQGAAIRERNIFREVGCCFWKEEPSLRDALFFFGEPDIHEVYVVPNFISEGYFTQTVIPRELELKGRLTTRPNGQIWKYCEPVGNHPAMTELLLRRAREVAPCVSEAETTLLIVGHGTALNDNSAIAAKREVARIRARGHYGSVQNAYMEEAPLISDYSECSCCAVLHFRRIAQLPGHPGAARDRARGDGSSESTLRVSAQPASAPRPRALLCRRHRDRAPIRRNHRGAGDSFRHGGP